MKFFITLVLGFISAVGGVSGLESYFDKIESIAKVGWWLPKLLSTLIISSIAIVAIFYYRWYQNRKVTISLRSIRTDSSIAVRLIEGAIARQGEGINSLIGITDTTRANERRINSVSLLDEFIINARLSEHSQNLNNQIQEHTHIYELQLLKERFDILLEELLRTKEVLQDTGHFNYGEAVVRADELFCRMRTHHARLQEILDNFRQEFLNQEGPQ